MVQTDRVIRVRCLVEKDGARHAFDKDWMCVMSTKYEVSRLERRDEEEMAVRKGDEDQEQWLGMLVNSMNKRWR